MRSEGQAWALEQLDELSKASGGVFEVLNIIEPAAAGDPLKAMLSVNLRSYERKEGGIAFRLREQLTLIVPAEFPIERPSLYFSHKRYGDHPHVQWGNYICLYQAPNSEWLPADGMFGFMARVSDWLRAAAAGQLNPTGMPLHPPVAYSTGKLSVVPRQNTPVPVPPYWAGYAEITAEREVSLELGRWIATSEDVPDTRLAAAVLLPTGMPYEYPDTMLDLLKALIDRGVHFELLRIMLTLGALRTDAGESLIFVLGAAMRGIAEGPKLQHLACWRIDPERAEGLRQAAREATDETPIDIERFYAWAADAKIEWCRVLEERPEIVERRDSQSPATWWHGKHAAVLGCGAIGSAVAVMLARAGVGKLQLYDNSVVKPGILVRQQFERRQIGYTKASATEVKVLAVNPDADVKGHFADVSSMLRDDEKRQVLLSADVIIDATASRTLATALEKFFRNHPRPHPPIIAMTFGHQADFAMMTMANGPAGAGFDLDRRTKVALASSSRGGAFFEEFWPDAGRHPLFQPEPGCSDPTFRGSAADVLGLSSRMTNVAATWLTEASRSQHRSYVFNLSNRRPRNSLPEELEFSWPPDLVVPDGRHGYEVRVSRPAYAAMLSWVRRSERVNGARNETGGILFGQADEFLKVIWVDEVSGPPPDSFGSPEAFICGTEGVAEMNREKTRRTKGSVGFVGIWHTHPQSMPIPSTTDRRAMVNLLDGGDYLGRCFLMIIVGGNARRPIISGSVFERSEYAG